MDIAFQLYSARNFQPYEVILEQLASLGYTQVEGFGGMYDEPNALRASLDRHGLRMPSGHFSLDMLENDFPAAAHIAATLGMSTLICPFIPVDERPADAAGWSALGARLEALAQRCQQAGYGVAWHNHDFEFHTLQDGRCIQNIILDSAPSIGWEMDVAWVVRGGADPMAWIDAYGSRIVAVHIKDIAPAGECADEDGWADVGYGVVPWQTLLPAIRATTRATVFAMEHDNPSDVLRFARRSIDTLRSL